MILFTVDDFTINYSTEVNSLKTKNQRNLN